MIKSDDHMGKVKARLVFEKKKIESFEARKAQQEGRRRQKLVGAERSAERSAKKRANLDSIAKWRKDHQGTGTGGDDLDDAIEGRRTGREKKARAFNKRQKYGVGGTGGREGTRKNTAASTDDTREFNARHGGSAGRKISKAKKKTNRPGKWARARK